MDKNALSQILDEVDNLSENYLTKISDDQLLADLLRNVSSAIEQTLAGEIPTPEELENIANQLDKAIAYAKDEAEEEQRIVADSPMLGGNEEEEALYYFDLCQKLRDCEENLRILL